MRAGAIPETDPRLLTRAILGLYNSIWHWYRPNGIVALDRVADFFTERRSRWSACAPEAPELGEGRRMSSSRATSPPSTGPTRTPRWISSPTDVEFAIQWAAATTATQPPVPGGREELRGFIDAGDMRRLGAPRPARRPDGDVEFALGETRWDDGERIGTFLAVAQLDADGRMERYMVARSPAIAFARMCGSMPASGLNSKS